MDLPVFLTIHPYHPSCVRTKLIGQHIGHVQESMGERITLAWSLQNYFTINFMLISGNNKIKTSVKIRGSLNKFPDFFRMGTFIDSTLRKL